ncbi:MAG: rhodanese-like domain-containing protein [Planctomycetaceae bacterium]
MIRAGTHFGNGSSRRSETATYFNFTFRKSPMEISCEAIHARRLRGDSFVLLDCREQDEWDFCKIDGAMLIPMSELQSRVTELESHRDSLMVVYCHHGVRSLRVAMWLQQQGFQQATSMAGGIEEWSLNIDRGVPRY